MWNSLLKPSIDLELDKIERSVVRTGPTRKLIDEGRVWAGGLTSQLRLAGQEPGPGDHVNASEVLDAAGDLLELLEEVAGGGASPVGESSAAIKITDGIRRIRRAAAKVNDTRTRIADANPLKRLTELSPQQRMSGPNSPENVAAREFWAKQGAPTVTRPIGDSIPTRVRDLVAQASRMPPSRERNELLAEAGRAQWSG
ncbi:MAG TPA: hypothetical protein VKT54_13860 [Steroidobacteraceae bacterium]|nr:hypothetical protein [Steroidobacteraceae bacterium]